MDSNRRLDLINNWTENENQIARLIKQLEEANKLKEKIEDEIPSLRETGKWEVKFSPPKKPSEAKKSTTYKGESVSKSKKRKLKTEEAMRKKMAKMAAENQDPLGLRPSGGIDKSQDFARANN